MSELCGDTRVRGVGSVRNRRGFGVSVPVVRGGGLWSRCLVSVARNFKDLLTREYASFMVGSVLGYF